MTIAVVFALEAEWAAWRSHHAFRPVAHGHPAAFKTPGTPIIYAAPVGPSHARVALSGVGARGARGVIGALCADPVDAVLAVGLAGALRDSYAVGDVIVARRAQSARTGSSAASDERLVSLASQCGAQVVDVLVTAERVVGQVADKRRLAAHGAAVDMESFRILDEAGRRGIPSVAIRVIGDTAGEALPLDFDRAVRADGSVSVMSLVGQAMLAPSRWPALVAFGYRQRRAVRELAGFLDRFVSALGGSPE